LGTEVNTKIKINSRYSKLHFEALLYYYQKHFVVLFLKPLDVINRGDDTGITAFGMDKS
jgi:hypothetical protein